MNGFRELLRARLARLGMPTDHQTVEIVAKIAEAHSDSPEALHDLSLMTIAVEAYRSPDSPVHV